MTGVQERAQEGCVPDTPPRQDRAFTPEKNEFTRWTAAMTASSQLVSLLPNLASGSAVRTQYVQSLPRALQRRWASQMSCARTLIPSTHAVPTNGFARIQQALVNKCCNRPRQACSTPQSGAVCVRVPYVADRCCPRVRPSAARSRDTRIRLQTCRRRPSSRQHVSLFTSGDEADKKGSVAIKTAALAQWSIHRLLWR